MKIPKAFYLSLLIAIQGCNSKNSAPEQPNVLFIIADDLGYHDLSCTGSDYYETPNIDRIAAEGMEFTQGYANCRVCSPSRASIMSGRFTARHGITDWIGAATGEAWRERGRYNKLLPASNVENLPHEYVTLPESLKQHGYVTFFAGKWHLGSEGSWPEDHGFDINIGGWDSGSPRGGYYGPWSNPNLESKEDGESLTMRLANETADFIAQHKDTTFFAYLSFYAVHGPIQTTQPKWEKYREKAVEAGLAEKGFRMNKYLPIRQVQDNPIYAGLVETMDDAVGVVLKALDSLGIADKTIVVFTSDNGGVSSGDSFSTSNLPMRGGKGYQYEGGIREPYFMKIPWLDIAGKTSDVPVIGSDFYPTLLELSGAELNPEQHPDGVSLVPLLKGDSIADRSLVWHYPHYGNQGGAPSSIIRRGDWKLIHYYEDGSEALYNLKSDPTESENMIEVEGEIAAELGKDLFAYLNSVGALFPTPDPEYDPAKEEAYLDRIRNEFMPRLEKRRLEYLSEDYDPGNNWWDSQTED